MLEGKRFLPETGIPILKMARKMVLLAVELPEPFFVPTMIEKSLTTLSMRLLNVITECVSVHGAAVRLQNLRSVMQKVGMFDECFVAGLKIAITNGYHHLLVVLPYFVQI